MAEEIKPALTPEEWRCIATGDRIDKWATLVKPWGAPELPYQFVFNEEYSVEDGAERHAIAALALHEMPFGFTQDDVNTLHHGAWLAGSVNPSIATKLQSVAGRIAALLPPL